MLRIQAMSPSNLRVIRIKISKLAKIEKSVMIARDI